MTATIGRLRQIGIGKETTPGTGVAASYWIGCESGDVAADVDYTEDSSNSGRIEAPNASIVTREDATINVTAVARSDWLGHVLKGALGASASDVASGESAVWEHIFTVSNTAAHTSHSLVLKDGVVTERSVYAMLNSMTLSCEANGLLMCDMEWLGRALADTTATPAYASDHIWKGSQCNVKLATDLSGLAAASAVKFNRVALTIEKGLVRHPTLGSITMDRGINTALRITGELDLLYEAATYRDFFTDGSNRAMRIAFDGDAIGVAEFASLQIDLAKCHFTEYSRDGGNDDPIIQKLGFVAHFDMDEGTPQMITATLTNEETTTVY